MGALAGISGTETIAKLRKMGYEVVRKKGSHARLRHPNSSVFPPLTIPLHKELKIGLLARVISESYQRCKSLC